jgi:hypothetical protein
MKVELEKLRLGISALLGRVYVYIPETKNPEIMRNKLDVTEDFERVAKTLGYSLVKDKKD